MMKKWIILLWVLLPLVGYAQTLHFRINQQGYKPEDKKVAILFSESDQKGQIFLIETASEKVVKRFNPVKVSRPDWGRFSYYYEVDFSDWEKHGTYYFSSKRRKYRSKDFNISTETYTGTTDQLLSFMRQQRCGYNPELDMVCHPQDGRTFYGPMPDSTFIDVSGGWHDAGDQLKYLITSSYATAHMLKAYELYPSAFSDKVNALGQPGGNGWADVLDEARWGLDWIHKMHPASDQLFHQVADDRDHRGWKLPNRDSSDYGWGPNSYRAAYFATGEPQGLREYKSKATGIANLAGRSSAAMSIAYRLWKDTDPAYALTCLEASKSLYQLGRAQKGFQQGNSYGAPYRYNETTWADDMEWAAAELYKNVKDPRYLEEAKEYAEQIGLTSWMNRDSASHYEMYPFINMGHYSLFEVADQDWQMKTIEYYKAGIEYNLKRANNPYHVGVPFIWCSNNLLTGLITQIILYQRMTSSREYDYFLHEQRDWLFGRNPWGTSMYTGMPANGETPVDIHTSIWALKKREVPGGLVDGPVYKSIYDNLKGIALLEDDEFKEFQNEYVVYHDDIGDYSTNEPTMDGTAGSILLMAFWSVNHNKD